MVGWRHELLTFEASSRLYSVQFTHVSLALKIYLVYININLMFNEGLNHIMGVLVDSFGYKKQSLLRCTYIVQGKWDLL